MLAKIRYMRSVALALLCVGSVLAQSPTDVFEKAPPEIDKALRERIAIFFQAHVDAKFRRAEQVIHEDSLDDYYNSEKTKLVQFTISKITYSEKYTKAVVICDVELDWITSRGKIRVKPPMKSLWKLEKGQWWWYAPPRGNWETPWGVMKSGDESANGSSMTAPRPKMADPNEILNAVVADKSDIQLDSAKASEDSATITADLPGEVRLEVRPHGIPGLKVTIDNQTIRQGSPANIKFSYEPPDESPKSPRIVYIHANPLGKVFSFTLNFRQPAPVRAPMIPMPQQPPVAPKKL